MLSTEKTQAIFKAFPTPCIVLLPDAPRFTIVDLNEAYTRVTHKTPNYLVSKGLLDAFSEGANEEAQSSIRQVSANLQKAINLKQSVHGEPFRFDLAPPGSSEKEMRYWMPEDHPILNADGEVEMIMHCVMDVTRHVIAETKEKEAYERLQWQEQYYKSLFAHHPDAVYSFDLKGNFLSANDQLAQLAEGSLEEILQLNFAPFIAPEDHGKVYEHFKKASAGEIQHYETSAISLKGNRKILDVTNLPIIVQGNIVGVYGIAKDITEKKKSEIHLQLSEQRFHRMVDGVKEYAIVMLNRHGVVEHWNEGAEKMLGYATAEIIGKKFQVFFKTEEIHDRVPEQLLALAKQHQNTSKERWFLRKNGSAFWGSMSLAAIEDDKHQVIGFTNVIRDLTDQQTFAMETQKAKNLYDMVAKATNDIIWVWELDTDKITWNNALTSVLGFDFCETDANWWYAHIHPEDQERVLTKIHDHIDRKIESWSDEYRFFCHDGTYKYFFDRGYLNIDPNGKAVRMIGAMQDISRSKEEENRLRLLESVITHSTDGVMVIEIQRTPQGPHPWILYINDAFTQMTGYELDEVIGKSPDFLRGENTDPIAFDRLLTALRTGQSAEEELILYKKTEEEYWTYVSFSPVTDSNGTCTHYIAIGRDTTERRKQVEEIEAQNIKLREIAWTQSHVVRAPLARLLGLAQILSMYKSEDRDTMEVLQRLVCASQELDQVVKEVVRKTEEVYGQNPKTLNSLSDLDLFMDGNR